MSNFEAPSSPEKAKEKRPSSPVGLYTAGEMLKALREGYADPQKVSEFLGTLITAMRHAGEQAGKVVQEMLKNFPLTENGVNYATLSEAAAHGESGLDFKYVVYADVSTRGEGAAAPDEIIRALVMAKSLVDVYAAETKRDPNAGGTILRGLFRRLKPMLSAVRRISNRKIFCWLLSVRPAGNNI